MSNDFLPKEFKNGHELCFFIHDVLASIIVEGEKENIFKYEFDLEEKLADKINEEDILDSLEKEGLYKDRNKVLKTIIIPALLSDSLHCIYEALNSSKKAKLNISYMLIRKPIQESLYLFESMVINELKFGRSMNDNPLELRPSTTMKNKGILGHKERIEDILLKLDLSNLFSSSYLANLRYNKKCDDNFDGICNQAMHLFTEHNAIKTEKLNINFIFSSEDSIFTQWSYLYSRLPYILLYMYYLIEYLVKEICVTKKKYLKEIELRIFAHIILWWEDLEDRYENKELEILSKYAYEVLSEYCQDNNYKIMDKKLIEDIANEGILIDE